MKILSLAPKSYSYDEGKMLCRHDWFIQYWMTVTCRGPQRDCHNLREPGRSSHSVNAAANCRTWNDPCEIRWFSVWDHWVTSTWLTNDLQCSVSLHHTQSQGCQKEPSKDTRGISTLNHYREGVRSEIQQNCSVNNCIHLFLSMD